MKHAEAIERLKGRFMTVSMCAKSAEAKAENEAIDMALAALRAEEEREKGMEWEKRETSGGLLAICPKCKYPVSWWHKTPFCGNCGRKLDGGGQDGC